MDGLTHIDLTPPPFSTAANSTCCLNALPEVRATLLPAGFVAEDVTPIPGENVLIVDDLEAMMLIAREN